MESDNDSKTATHLRSIPSKVIALGDLPRKYAEAYTVPIGRLLDGDIPEVEFLIPGCIPRKAVVMINGESGAKKSWVAYELARAVATGQPWMGRGRSGEKPETVLILNYDNATSVLTTRFRKLSFHSEMPVYVHTQGLTTPPSRGAPEILILMSEAQKLRYILDHYQPALVIFDSLRQGHNLDENDSEQARALMAVFKSWTEVNKCTVLLIHHTTKSGTSSWAANGRGSGEFIASADVVMEVAEDTIKWTKCRPWPIGETTETTFTVTDHYIGGEDGEDSPLAESEVEDIEDDVEQLTTVKATMHLPGEKEWALMERIILEVKNSKYPVGRAELMKRISMPASVLKNGILACRTQGFIKMTRTSQHGRGFVLTDLGAK